MSPSFGDLADGYAKLTNDLVGVVCQLITNHLATVFGLLSGMASCSISQMIIQIAWLADQLIE